MSPMIRHADDRVRFSFERTLLAALAAGLLGAASPALSANGTNAANGEHIDRVGNGHNVANNPARRAALAQRALESSDALLRSLKALERSPAAARSQRAREVLQQAAERKQAMIELMQEDPARAISIAMPASLRDRLPREARVHVEHEVATAGTVVGMLIDDIERGISRHPVFLEIDGPAGRERIGLHWADRSLTEEQMMALIDRRVRVRGLRLDEHLLVGDRTQIEMAEAGGKGNDKNKDGSTTTSTSGGTTGTSTEQMAASTSGPLVSGEQRTLVILGNFSDKAVGCSVADVDSRLFGATSSVDRILRESSRDAVRFSGDVVGPFTIPYSSGSTCDYKAWGTAADAAARAAGIDPSRYARISYALPSNSSCGWSGIANLGGTLPTRSWVLSCSTTGLYAHEIGHNLRFHHASTPTSEYGDYSDPMGYSKTVQMNAANRVMAGWLPSGNVVDAASSGSYTIAALAAPDTGSAQVVRLPKPDTNEFYYVSLRQSQDLDVNLGSTWKDVVSVHRASGTMPSKTVLMARLAAGQTFTDAANSISIGTQAVTTGNATVSIQMAGPTCARSAPTIGVSPASQTGSPGETLRYQVALTNRNSSACAGSEFVLTQSGPTGFSGGFSSSSVTLASGASTTVTWSVASATGSGDGIYPLAVSATQSGTSGTSTSLAPVSASASYVVYSDGAPPTVSITSPRDGATLASKPLTLSATAFDDDGIAQLSFYVNGQLAGTTSTAPYQARWNPRKAKGPQILTVRAVDRSGNEAESMVSFTLK